MEVVEKIFTIVVLIGFATLMAIVYVPFIKYWMKVILGGVALLVIILAITYITKPLLSPICDFIGIPFDLIAVSICVAVSIPSCKLIASWLEKEKKKESDNK